MENQGIIRLWIIIPLVYSLKHENYHNYKVKGKVLLNDRDTQRYKPS